MDTSPPTPPEDFYTHNADLYGALIRPVLTPLNSALAGLLDETLTETATRHPALDLGSGIGTALPVLAARADRLYAVEPSAAMRAGLMAVVATDDDLAARTTVLGGTLDQVAHLLPATLGTVTALNVIGHLDDDALAGFWELLASSLAPGAPVIISLQGPLDGTPVPWTDFGASRIGDLTYRTEGRAEPQEETGDRRARGARMMCWTMRWTTSTSDGEVLETRQATTTWRLRTPEDLTARAADAGCEPGPSRPDLLLYSYIRSR